MTKLDQRFHLVMSEQDLESLQAVAKSRGLGDNLSATVRLLIREEADKMAQEQKYKSIKPELDAAIERALAEAGIVTKAEPTGKAAPAPAPEPTPEQELETAQFVARFLPSRLTDRDRAILAKARQERGDIWEHSIAKAKQ